MFNDDLKDEIRDFFDGDLPVGPDTRDRLRAVLRSLKTFGKLVELMLTKPRQRRNAEAVSTPTGLVLSRLLRGKEWNAMAVDDAVKASPLSGGYGIQSVTAGSPAARLVNAGHLKLTDVVTKINGMKIVGAKGSEAAVSRANDFGDALKIKLTVWRRSGA